LKDSWLFLKDPGGPSVGRKDTVTADGGIQHLVWTGSPAVHESCEARHTALTLMSKRAMLLRITSMPISAEPMPEQHVVKSVTCTKQDLCSQAWPRSPTTALAALDGQVYTPASAGISAKMATTPAQSDPQQRKKIS